MPMMELPSNSNRQRRPSSVSMTLMQVPRQSS